MSIVEARPRVNYTDPVAPGAQLPPGPGWLPRWAGFVLWFAVQPWWGPWVRRRYGNVAHVPNMFNEHSVQISDPALIQELHAGPPEIFHAGEGNVILSGLMGKHSVLTTDEDEHKRLRKLSMSGFTGPALRGYRNMISVLAAKDAESLPVGRPTPIFPRMRALTLDIIVQVIFGVTNQRRIVELSDALRTLIDHAALGVLLEILPTRLRRIPPFRGFLHAARRVDELLYQEIAERRTECYTGRADLLSRLMAAPVAADDIGFTDEELRDQLMALLLAGHDTTSSALAWTFHELAHNQVLQGRVIAAVDSSDDDFLEAVVKETLRRHTIITATARKVTKDITVDGYRIPKGFTLSPAIVVLHRDQGHHVNPLAFRPERFLGTNPEPGTWMPFGGGVRRCIGASLSLMEATIILKETFSRYQIAPDHHLRENPPVPRNLSLVPSRGTRIIAIPRRTEHVHATNIGRGRERVDGAS